MHLRSLKSDKARNLIDTIENNSNLLKIASVLFKYRFESCYFGAGAIAQTVWNVLTNRSIDYGIDDLDIIYFNSVNIEENCESKVIEYLNKSIGTFPFKIDVKNEARVHLWYKQKFGYDIKPYHSAESAIDTWPTTATSVGIRKVSERGWEIYAPFGLDDLFEMNVVANNRQITEKIYNNKVLKWINKWPELNVVPWNNEVIPFAINKKIYIEK